MQSSEWLEIGKILSAQGLKGEIKIYPNSDFPERFLEPGPRWLLRPNQTEPEPVSLERGRYLHGKGLYVIKLAGIDDREEADALRNCKLLVPESDRPPLDEDEFHVRDLVDLAVFDQSTGERVGTVSEVIPAGNDLLEVTLAQPRGKMTKALIPFVKAIVPVVDLVQKRIEINPPPGLIE